MCCENEAILQREKHKALSLQAKEGTVSFPPCSPIVILSILLHDGSYRKTMHWKVGITMLARRTTLVQPRGMMTHSPTHSAHSTPPIPQILCLLSLLNSCPFWKNHHMSDPPSSSSEAREECNISGYYSACLHSQKRGSTN